MSCPPAWPRTGRKLRRGDAVSRRLTWSLMLGVAVSLAALIASTDQDAITSLLRHDAGSLVLKAALAVCAGGLLLTLFREKLSRVLEAALFWVVIVLLLAVGYTYRMELRDAGDRVLAELMPGHVAGRGRNVEIVRAHSGDFAVAAHINGARVPMVLDSGATSVVLTQDAAKAAGLPIEVLNYSVNVDTANGRTRAAAVTLDRLAVGGLIERAVPALVAQPGQLKSNLLGMSFLNRLQSWEVRGDKLRMRGFP
jgi:aspartyl protease family protein